MGQIMKEKKLDGKKTAAEILAKIKKEVATFSFRKPKLSCILVGNDPASHTYVRMKKRRCEEVGILSEIIELDETISEKELLALVEKQNKDPHVDGILVQQPLPSHISPQKIIAAVDPSKDVDGFHPVNAGKILTEDSTGFVPCTPLGIFVLLHENNIDLAGKHIVIMGRSAIVGKPLAALLLQKGIDATVSVVHSKTKNVSDITEKADILVVAIGKPHSVSSDMIKKGAIVIDVGITRTDTGLFGDVAPGEIDEKAAQYTPVPGGVGPMTVAMLLFNTLKSFKMRIA